MPKKSISGSSRKDRHTTRRQRVKKTTAKASTARTSTSKTRKKPQLLQQRFVGVCLGGGKTNRTSVAVVDYFPEHKKVFLSKIFDRIGGEGTSSADAELLKILAGLDKSPEAIAFDVPLQLPKCIRCRLLCPGYDKCKVPEIQWLRKNHAKHRAKKRPRKPFTPYTQRCVEQYLAHELDEAFWPQHALGANLAPLTARAQYLLKHIRVATLEVFPEAALWRIGKALKLSRLHLRYHRHSTEGEVSRLHILQKFVETGIVFIYEQDIQLMAHNSCAFDAFLSAFTAHLQSLNLCEARPKGFPKQAGWVWLPLEEWLKSK